MHKTIVLTHKIITSRDGLYCGEGAQTCGYAVEYVDEVGDPAGAWRCSLFDEALLYDEHQFLRRPSCKKAERAGR